MIIVVDSLNRNKFERLLAEMFELRARVFGGRLGWDVPITDGQQTDHFDRLDPVYIIGVNGEGHVISSIRTLPTTGLHMLSDIFYDILDGEPPLRSATLWKSSRFCVDTHALSLEIPQNSVSYATCELMIGALEYAKDAGIADIIAVIDPSMDRALQRSHCAPYDYIGKPTPMGKASAIAALLDCTDQRIERLRAFAGIKDDVFLSEEQAEQLTGERAPQRRRYEKPRDDLSL